MITLPGTNTPIGCFKDDLVRHLSGFFLESKSLTVEWCADTCRRMGFLFAGLEVGEQCFCGNSIGKYSTGDPSTCNSPCFGKLTQTCGGLWRLDVYYLGT